MRRTSFLKRDKGIINAKKRGTKTIYGAFGRLSIQPIPASRWSIKHLWAKSGVIASLKNMKIGV